MNALEKYEAVNRTESLEELAEIIKLLANEQGMIMGRSYWHPIQPMIDSCLDSTLFNPVLFTRSWGIRQQASMLIAQGKYKRKEK